RVALPRTAGEVPQLGQDRGRGLPPRGDLREPGVPPVRPGRPLLRAVVPVGQGLPHRCPPAGRDSLRPPVERADQGDRAVPLGGRERRGPRADQNRPAAPGGTDGRQKIEGETRGRGDKEKRRRNQHLVFSPLLLFSPSPPLYSDFMSGPPKHLRWPIALSILAPIVTIGMKSTAYALTGSAGLFS